MVNVAMKHNNFDELEKEADLDPELRQRMSMIKKSSVLYEKVKQLFTSAQDYKNGLEGSYILFNRCINVCNILMSCEDFNSFRRTPDAPRFHKIFDASLNEVERLQRELISMYDSIALSRLQSQPVEIPIVRQVAVHPIDSEGFGNYIKPKQLVQYVDELRKIVLILDYRLRKDPNIRYADSNFIRTLPLDLSLIASGLIFNHLRMYIDFRYRPTISEIQNYDLVVLMGDELEHPNATPFKNGTKTKILLEAITKYNFHNQLKRNPLLLEGGFKAWENSYPMYVERLRDHAEFHDNFNLSDDFTNLVKLVKQNLGSELVYPELFARVEQPSKPTSPQRKPSPPPRPPLSTISNVPPTNSTEFPVTFDSEPVAFNNKPEYRPEVPIVSKFDKKLPLVPTLGGARMDTSTSAPGPVVVPPRPVQPPPIPERTIKPLDEESQQRLLYVTQLYDHSKHAIDRGAARSQVPPGYCGLINLGNTCFMNSALQALFNTPGTRNIFTQKKFTTYINPRNKASSAGIISACFSALMDSAWSCQYRYIQPDNFLCLFAREVNSQLADRTQHDSQEFLSLLVDSIHEETNRVDIKKPFEQNYDGSNIRIHAEHYNKHLHLFASSPINDLFGLTNITQLTCMTCNTSSVTFCDNPLTLLELPVDHGSYCSLRECLKHSFGEDALDGVHRWNCPKCKCAQRTLRSSKIWSLPPVLVICLKRFAMRNGVFVKNDINVDFSIKNLDMTPYIHKDAPQNIDPCYQLYAMTDHEGTLNNGHYTSIIHNAKTGRWLKFDDEKVGEIDPELHQNKKAAYILFYKNVSLSNA